MATAQISIGPGKGSQAGRVNVLFEGRGASMPWDQALEFGRCLMRCVDAEYVPELDYVRRWENGHVDVLLGGQLWFNGASESVARIGKAIVQVARQVEEQVKADQVIADQALGIRAGLPYALSSNGKILSEARKEADGNRTLRRAIVSSRHVDRQLLGLPRLVQHSPEPRQAVRDAARQMNSDERRALMRDLEAVK